MSQTITFGPSAENFNVSRTLTSQYSRIRFNGLVSEPSMQMVADTMDEAFSYYHYDSIEIEINSPGGDARALDYLLEHCENWRVAGRKIATRGGLTCGSAGALMLSFGDIGTRQVSKSTELLFHHSRAMMEKAFVTAHVAEQMAIQLNALDRKMVDTLVNHILPHGDDAAFDGLALMQNRYHWLNVNFQESGESTISEHISRKEMLLLRHIFGGPEVKKRERVIEYIRSRFQADKRMALLEAYVLNLIDEVRGVTPSNEPGACFNRTFRGYKDKDRSRWL